MDLCEKLPYACKAARDRHSTIVRSEVRGLEQRSITLKRDNEIAHKRA
jgi:hypothetical protein